MPRRLHDDEILELVEQPLEQPGATLPSGGVLEPSLAATVAGMRADRARLRSLTSPPLPRDFVAALEDRLQPPAPMVPGAGRRDRVSPWSAFSGRLALAAGLALAAAATTWLTLGNIATTRTIVGADPSGASAEASPRSGGADHSIDSRDDRSGLSERALAENDLHHPAPAPSTDNAPSGPSLPSRVVVAEDDATDVPTVALVISGSDLDSAMEALRAAIDGIAPTRGALVRNFSLAEAIALDSRWRRSLPLEGEPARAPAVASRQAPTGVANGTSRSGRALDGRADGGLGQRPGGTTLDGTALDGRGDPSEGTLLSLGEHLAGDRRFATAPELQFELAERGFAHSITLPVADVRKLLVTLAVDGRVRVQLGRVEAVAVATEGSAQSPIESWRRWQDAAAALSALEASAATDGRVTLPVRVETPREERSRPAR